MSGSNKDKSEDKEKSEKKAEHKDHKSRKWLKKDKDDFSKKEFEALTPKQKLQVKYKELLGEKPDEKLTKDKLEEAIEKEKGHNGKSDSSDKTKKPHIRPSGNKDAPDTTATLEPLTEANPKDWLGTNSDPDVFLSVPNLGVDHIGLKVKNLYAHVNLNAQVLDLVKLHVGADVGIEEVSLEINNVRVQAMLKVKLEKVREIVGDVVGLLDNHPEILTNLTGGLGKGLEGALSGKRGSVDKLSDKEKASLLKELKESNKKKEEKEKEESDKD